MSDDTIVVEPRQEAVLRYDDEEVACRTVPEAWLTWAQLELEQKEHAVIEIDGATYGLQAIRRLRYPMSEAA
jgi:hypothetical protein